MPPVRTKTKTKPRPRAVPKEEDFTPEIEHAILVAIVDTVLASRKAITARPELASVAGNGGSELGKKVVSHLKLRFGVQLIDDVIAARKGEKAQIGGQKKRKAGKVKKEEEENATETEE